MVVRVTADQRDRKRRAFVILFDRAKERGLETIVLVEGRGESSKAVVAVRSDDKIIERMDVKRNESIDTASKRLFMKMKREKIL